MYQIVHMSLEQLKVDKGHSKVIGSSVHHALRLCPGYVQCNAWKAMQQALLSMLNELQAVQS